jgi:hypothetical protein
MWQVIIPLLGKIFDQIIPDPKAAAEAKLRVIELQQAGELAALDADLKIALAQAGINAEEAKSTSLLVSGWRPFIGWCCGIGLAYVFLAHPLLTWWAAATRPEFVPPALVVDHLVELVMAMLGLVGLRTFEKIKGVAAR